MFEPVGSARIGARLCGPVPCPSTHPYADACSSVRTSPSIPAALLQTERAMPDARAEPTRKAAGREYPRLGPHKTNSEGSVIAWGLCQPWQTVREQPITDAAGVPGSRPSVLGRAFAGRPITRDGMRIRSLTSAGAGANPFKQCGICRYLSPRAKPIHLDPPNPKACVSSCLPCASSSPDQVSLPW